MSEDEIFIQVQPASARDALCNALKAQGFEITGTGGMCVESESEHSTADIWAKLPKEL